MKRTISILFILLLSSLLAALSFTGNVFDQQTLDPIQGAIVRAGGENYSIVVRIDTTDAAGGFEINDLDSAFDYTIQASAINHISWDTLMQQPSQSYQIYLQPLTSGILVETINEGLRNYEFNGSYWSRTDMNVYDNSNQDYFYNINAQSDTISLFLAEITELTDYTDNDDEIYERLSILWNWLADGNNTYFNAGSPLWQEAHQYLLDQSEGHAYTIEALAKTYFVYEFIPWGTCMSRANIMATLLYRLGIAPDRFFIPETRWHFRYSQHMYIMIKLFGRWYHFDPVEIYQIMPPAEEFHSLPGSILSSRDYAHPWRMHLLPEATITEIPASTYKIRNQYLYITSPPEKTHTIDSQIEVSGYADGSQISSVIIQGSSYSIAGNSFQATVDLVNWENAITVSTADQQWSDEVVIIKDSYCRADFSASIRQGLIPLAVQFTDRSTVSGPVMISEWRWDFNNDSLIDSYEPNPEHIFEIPGDYTVSLFVSNGLSEDTLVRGNYIKVYEYYLEGYAGLAGQTLQEGILVQVLSWPEENSVSEQVTDSTGYYEAYTNSGNVILKFSYPDYFPRILGPLSVNENTICENVVLDPRSSLIMVPQYFTRIQEAVDFALDGDTIRISPGIYQENISIGVKSLTLESLYALYQEEPYIEQTVISGHRSGSVVTIGNAVNVTLNGLTITGGSAEYGGGIDIFRFILAGKIKLLNLHITDNNADYGGGLSCRYSPVYGENLLLSGNIAGSAGGGIHLYHSYPDTLYSITCLNNTSTGNGSGIFIQSCDSVILNDLMLEGNFSSASGGGMYITSSHVNCSNAVINGNRANMTGAGVFANVSTFYLYNSCLTSNTISGWGTGGGSYLLGSDSRVINCLFMNNYASNYGSALIGNGVGDILCANNVFYSNNSFPVIHLFGSNINLTARNNLFWEEGTIFSDCNDSLGIIVDLNYNGDPCDAFCNIFLEPALTDTAEGNYHLLEDSPCIDAGWQDTTGLDLPAYDLDYCSRINNSIIDIGCYEFSAYEGLTAPENITLCRDEENVYLSWDPVSAALSYLVYSSPDADGPFTLEANGFLLIGRERVTWFKPCSQIMNRQFFRVTTSNRIFEVGD